MLSLLSGNLKRIPYCIDYWKYVIVDSGSFCLQSRLLILRALQPELNYNPHSLTLVTPNPTSSPSTQLFLVYNTYEYPHREEEKDSRMAGFKLGVFDREAHLIGPQESCCSTIGRSQKAVWILAHLFISSDADHYKHP